jgi:hypothetical protein
MTKKSDRIASIRRFVSAEYALPLDEIEFHAVVQQRLQAWELHPQRIVRMSRNELKRIAQGENRLETKTALT